MVKKKQTAPRIKNADMKHLGTEPTEINSREDYIRALNWYNYFFELKDARKWLKEYCSTNSLPYNADQATITMCSISRMIMNGVDVPTEAKEYLSKKLAEVKYKEAPKRVQATPVLSVVRENQIIADIDDLIDQFYNGGYVYFEPDAYAILIKNEVIAKHAKMTTDYYVSLRDDVVNHPEDYMEHGKRKYNTYVKFLEDLVSSLEQYTANKKAVRKPRKPRKRKAADPTKLVSNVKYQKEDPTLRLVSQDPRRLVGAKYAWLYNTKYRKLVYIQAENGTELSVKGTTIQGVSAKDSFEQMVRKPDEVLPQFVKSAKLAKKKIMKGLTTKPSKTTGRINANTIILEVK